TDPRAPGVRHIRARIVRGAARPQQVSVQQGSQDRCPYAGGIKAEKMSPRQQQAGVFPRVHCSLLGGHSLVMVSSRFRIRLATAVYAANSAAFNFSSRPDVPWRMYWTAASGLSRYLCSYWVSASSRTSLSLALGGRAVARRNAYSIRASGVGPPSLITRSASLREASR